MIDLDQADIAPMAHIETDLRADQASQKVCAFGNHVHDAQNFGLQGLLARESQKLPNKVRGAIAVLLDLHDGGKALLAWSVPLQQQIAKADHGREQIVEVVRDPARKLADRLHLLRLRNWTSSRFCSVLR
jgi:hypothetical protein